jgi:hypothetical protein
VQSFPDPAIKDRVSVDGGQYVRLRRDGRELFYLTPDGRLMAVPIKPRTNSEGLDIGAPAALFETGLSHTGSFARQPYMASPDGQQFTLKGTNPPMTVVLNWRPEQGK